MSVKSAKPVTEKRTVKPRAAHGQRRVDLLAAARHCFAERGIEGTTVEAILERSGASIGSLYQHFAGKDGLAAALYVDGIAAFMAGALKFFEAATTSEDKVKALVRAYFDFVSADPVMARFLMQGRAYLDKTGHAAEIARRNNEFMMVIGAWYKQQARLRALRGLPPEYVLAIIEGPSRNFARKWLAGATNRSIAEAKEIFAQAAWDALKLDGETKTTRRKGRGS